MNTQRPDNKTTDAPPPPQHTHTSDRQGSERSHTTTPGTFSHFPLREYLLRDRPALSSGRRASPARAGGMSITGSRLEWQRCHMCSDRCWSPSSRTSYLRGARRLHVNNSSTSSSSSSSSSRCCLTFVLFDPGIVFGAASGTDKRLRTARVQVETCTPCSSLKSQG